MSEIGVNMEAFLQRNTFIVGLTSTNNESAGKKKSVRVSKVGYYIKPFLVKCANYDIFFFLYVATKILILVKTPATI